MRLTVIGNSIQKQTFYYLAIGILILIFTAVIYGFFQFQSLALDEAMLAVNFKERSIFEFSGRLTYNQVAPLAFIFIEKIIFQLLNQADWSLRLFPMFCYFASFPFFYSLNKYIFKKSSIALFSCVLLVINFNIYAYNLEVKQYIVDVFISILLLWGYFRYSTSKKALSLVYLSLLCAVSIWLSNIAVIIISAMSLSFLLLKIKQGINLKSVILPTIIIASSFLIYFFLFILNNPSREFMYHYWSNSDGFLPQPFFSYSFLENLFLKIKLLLSWVFSIADYIYLSSVLILFGISGFFKEKHILLLLLIPALIHLGLAYLTFYPFSLRLCLYLLPILFILLIKGALVILNYLNYKINFPILIIFTLALLPNVLPILKITPNQKEEIKGVLHYVENKIEKDEGVYIYYFSRPAYRFYKSNHPNILQSDHIVLGKNSRNTRDLIQQEIENLPKSSWLIFSHAEYKTNGQSDETYLLNYFEQNGYKVTDKHFSKGASTYQILRE